MSRAAAQRLQPPGSRAGRSARHPREPRPLAAPPTDGVRAPAPAPAGATLPEGVEDEGAQEERAQDGGQSRQRLARAFWRPAAPGVPGLVWRGAKRWSAAVVTAAFPAVFLLDGSTAWPVSPVLPAAAALTLAAIVLPLAIHSVRMGRLRRRAASGDGQKDAAAAEAFARRGRIALVASSAWFLLWLAWGV